MVMQANVLSVSCTITQNLKHFLNSVGMKLPLHHHLLVASILASAPVCVSALCILY